MKNKLKIAFILASMIGSTYGAADQSNYPEGYRTGENTTTTPYRTHQDLILDSAIEGKLFAISAEIDSMNKRVEEYDESIRLYSQSSLRSISKLQKERENLVALLDVLYTEMSTYIPMSEELKRGTIAPDYRRVLENWAFKVKDRVTNTNTGRVYTGLTKGSLKKVAQQSLGKTDRTEDSLINEAQQNCLGIIDSIVFDKERGALQKIVMSPSTKGQKPLVIQAVAPIGSTEPIGPKLDTPIGPTSNPGLSFEDILNEIEMRTAPKSSNEAR